MARPSTRGEMGGKLSSAAFGPTDDDLDTLSGPKGTSEYCGRPKEASFGNESVKEGNWLSGQIRATYPRPPSTPPLDKQT